MPAEFSREGICFQYPENWTLDESDTLDGGESVTVSSPGGAFWTVSVDPVGAEPRKLARAAVDALREVYEEIEVESVEDRIADREMVGYDLNFYCMDLTNTAQVRCFRTHRATYAIFFQAEDRELDRIGKVFLAMTISLLNHLQELEPED